MTLSDTQKQSTKFPLVFKPALLGIALPFSAFLVLVLNNSPVLELLDRAQHGIFVRSLLAAFAAGCLVVLLLQRFAGLPSQKDSNGSADAQTRKQRGAYQLLAAGILLLTCLAVTLLNDPVAFQGPLPVVLVAAGVLVGLALVPQLLSWAVFYARELPESSLFHAALSLILAALLYCVSILPLVCDVPLLYAGVLVLAAAFVLRHLMRAPAGKTADAAVLSSTDPKTPVPLKKIILMLWKPLVSGAITAFIIGLVWDPFAAEANASTELFEFLSSALAAPILAALLVIAALFFRPRHFSLHIYNDVVMPVAIGILLVVPLINFEPVDLTLITGLLSQCCFVLVALAVWTSLAAGVRTLGERPWVIFTLGFALFALCMLAGLYAIHLIGTNGQVLCLVLLAIFLVLMVLDVALKENPQGASRERMKEALEHYLQRRCDQLAERFGLSAREREVFLYLARGYGQVYIARELYVSENTIRTHVRHIYAKLGINSREELLQLIDSEA